MTRVNKPVYVLRGDDAFLQGAYRQEIVSAVLGGADPQVCVTSFEADAPLADVLDELRTLPFLAPCRVVILRDADAFITANREKLEQYLQSPSDTSTLVLMVDSWKSNTNLAKLVAQIGEVKECAFGADANLAGWLAKAAGKRGKKITREAASLLGTYVGRDLACLSNELEKLSLYVHPREVIEALDVAALTTATSQPVDFELTNAIAAGDVKQALKALDDLSHSNGWEFKALGSLGYHLRKVMAVQQRLAGGASPQEALRATRMPYHLHAVFLKLVQRRSVAKLQSDFRRLIRADLALKSGSEALPAMQELIVSLCT